MPVECANCRSLLAALAALLPDADALRRRVEALQGEGPRRCEPGQGATGGESSEALTGAKAAER